MKKALLILVTILLLTVLAILPTLGGGQIDDPYMLMVDGVLYLDTHTATQEPKADEIVGCTTSYTKKKPRKNGQTNIGKYEVPYADTDGGLAVRVGETWYLFKPHGGAT